MKKCNMKASIDSIETFATVDGPGIRTVVFLNSCKLRCKFCHNPETWTMKEKIITSDELVKKIIRNKPYFKNNGGVTFSGGEPLLQYEFLIEACKKLKKENIHIAIDTAGIGHGTYYDLLKTIDMVLLDIKHINKEGYLDITQVDKFEEFQNFINQLNKTNIEVWIRQVIIPEVNDNEKYINDLANFIKNNIKNVTKIDFLPYHKLGDNKYQDLGIKNPYINKKEMDKDKCNALYNKFLEIYKKSN